MKAAWVSLTFTSLILIVSQPAATQDVVSAWFPTGVGDTWTYQHEERFQNGHGMENPEIGRWREEHSIIESTKTAEGTLLHERIQPLDLVPENVAWHIPRIKEPTDFYVLIRGNCIYGNAWVREKSQNDFVRDILHQDVRPEVCFPLTRNMTWGRLPGTPAYDPDGVWTVIGLNTDPYGLANTTTFHFSARQGSGTMEDRWFAQGIGVLQQITEHHGTYEETRLQLLKTVLSGRPRTYQLTPAHTTVLNVEECAGYGWRHFVRANGTPFATEDACANYAKSRR